jgi:hypothetical protein
MKEGEEVDQNYKKLAKKNADNQLITCIKVAESGIEPGSQP